MTVHFEVHKSKVFQSIHFSEVHNASVFQSLQSCKAENLVQLNSDNKRRQERHNTSASETEEGHLRDSKRHKKLNYSTSDLGANNIGHIKPNAPPTENLITSSQLEIPANLNNSFNACGFCHSFRITAVNIYLSLAFVCLCAIYSFVCHFVAASELSSTSWKSIFWCLHLVSSPPSFHFRILVPCCILRMESQ